MQEPTPEPIAITQTTTTTTETKASKTTTTTTTEQDLDKAFILKIIVVIGLSSAVVLIAAARICDSLNSCTDELGFAVAAGVIGAAIGGLMLLVHFVSMGIGKILLQVLAIASAVLWTAGAGVLTFRSPFVATGNGYFASWMAFAASFYLVHLTVPWLDKIFIMLAKKANAADLDHRIVLVIFAASVIELTAAATLCDRSRKCEDQLGWAVAVGAVSTLVTLIFLVLSKFLNRVRMFIAILLVVVWIPGCGVLTFDRPFVITGNGYFSAWVAFFYSVYWFFVCFTTREK